MHGAGEERRMFSFDGELAWEGEVGVVFSILSKMSRS